MRSKLRKNRAVARGQIGGRALGCKTASAPTAPLTGLAGGRGPRRGASPCCEHVLPG